MPVFHAHSGPENDPTCGLASRQFENYINVNLQLYQTK